MWQEMRGKSHKLAHHHVKTMYNMYYSPQMTQKCSFGRKKQETSFQIDDMPVGASVKICIVDSDSLATMCKIAVDVWTELPLQLLRWKGAQAEHSEPKLCCIFTKDSLVLKTITTICQTYLLLFLMVVVGLVFQQQESVKSELIEKSFIGGYSSSSYFSSGVQFCFGDHYWCSGKCWGITTNMTVMLRMIIMINIIFCCVVDSGECIACGKG